MALSSGYKRYLKSDKWLGKRKDKLEEVDYECELCGKHGCTLQVHHLTYDRIFDEENKDLLVVCKPCHKYADRIRKSRKRISKGENLEIKQATNSIIKKHGYPHNFKTKDRSLLKEIAKKLEKLEENLDFFEEIQDLSEKEKSQLIKVSKGE